MVHVLLFQVAAGEAAEMIATQVEEAARALARL